MPWACLWRMGGAAQKLACFPHAPATILLTWTTSHGSSMILHGPCTIICCPYKIAHDSQMIIYDPTMILHGPYMIIFGPYTFTYVAYTCCVCCGLYGVYCMLFDAYCLLRAVYCECCAVCVCWVRECCVVMCDVERCLLHVVFCLWWCQWGSQGCANSFGYGSCGCYDNRVFMVLCWAKTTGACFLKMYGRSMRSFWLGSRKDNLFNGHR